jgi:hypothetical protein
MQGIPTMRIRGYPVILAFVVLFGHGPQAIADDTNARRYELPNHGAVEFVVRTNWKDEVRRPPLSLPPTITFSAASGSPFQILITPAWSTRGDNALPNAEAIKTAVQNTAQVMKPQAVETTITVSEFDHAAGPGYYFSLTDRAPAPGEFKYLTQGILRVGDLVISFTILTNDGQADIVAAALDMLRSAARIGGPSSAPNR